MSQEAKELLLEIRQNLSTVFGNSTLIKELKDNKDFQKTIAKQIGIHKRLETICKEDNSLTEKYSENFKNLTGENVDVGKFEHLNDIDEITDEVNYLNVVSKNLFNKKMSEFTIDVNNNVNLDENNKNSPSASTPDLSKNSTQNKPLNDEPLKGERVKAEKFNSQKNNSKAYGFNPNLFMNQNQGYDAQGQITYLAQKRLQVEIEIGKVYRWTEKQRGVLILQYIAVAFSLVFMLATAASLIVLIYAIVNDFSIMNADRTAYVAMRNVNSFGFLFPSIIVFFFGIYLVIKYLNDSQGKLGFLRKRKAIESAQAFLEDSKLLDKNENIMYHFQNSSILVAFFIYLILTLLPISISFSPILFLTSQNQFSDIPVSSNVPISGPIKDAVFYSFIVYFVSFVPLIIIFGISFKINPKTDVERLNSILEKYISDIKDVYGGPGPSFPGGFPGTSGPFGF